MIQVFQGQQRYLTLSDISKVANLPRATVRRVLYTLTRLGYVEVDGRLFFLTPKVLSLATSYLSSSSLSSILQPAVDRSLPQAERVQHGGGAGRRALHHDREGDPAPRKCP